MAYIFECASSWVCVIFNHSTSKSLFTLNSSANGLSTHQTVFQWWVYLLMSICIVIWARNPTNTNRVSNAICDHTRIHMLRFYRGKLWAWTTFSVEIFCVSFILDICVYLLSATSFIRFGFRLDATRASQIILTSIACQNNVIFDLNMYRFSYNQLKVIWMM